MILQKIPKVRRIFLRIPAVFIGITIWIISSQSVLPKPPGIFGFDKFQHFLAYAAFAVSLGLWFSKSRWSHKTLRTAFFTALMASFYGITDEIHQYFVPGRDCNFQDWIADTTGAVIGAGFTALFFCVKVKRRLI